MSLWRVLFVLGIILEVFPAVNGLLFIPSSNYTYADRAASFGPRANQTQGTLIPLSWFNASNINCCEDMELYPLMNNWIALVQRGNCAFVEKIRLAQKFGAKAVVVGDNVYSSTLISMYAAEDTSDISIPSVFVSRESYEELVQRARPVDENYNLQIVLIGTYLITWPMIDIVIITFIAPAIILIFLYTIWRFRRRSDPPTEVAPSSVVINLPTKIYSSADWKGDEKESCPICLEEFEEGNKLRLLPCGHYFHIACVDQWLITRKRFCPMCKKDVCISSSFDEDENSKPTTSNSPQFFSESDPLVPRRQFSDSQNLQSPNEYHSPSTRDESQIEIEINQRENPQTSSNEGSNSNSNNNNSNNNFEQISDNNENENENEDDEDENQQLEDEPHTIPLIRKREKKKKSDSNV